MSSPAANLGRVNVDIDQHSYLYTYHRLETKVIVVFIHGIFGDYKETWKETPLQLLTTPIMAEADLGSFGYRTEYLDFKHPRRVVDEFTLWARTHLQRYPSVYIVAHSMGGLVVRDVCGRLLASTLESDRQLFNQIRHCFLVAVPLSGSWAAKAMNKIPFLGKVNWRVGYLARPQVSRSSLEHYDQTIRQAMRLGLRRPKFSLFLGTEDSLVEEPKDWAVTKDDSYEGRLPGSHDSIKADLAVNSTLIRRIAQVVNSHVVQDTDTQRERMQVESTIRTREARARTEVTYAANPPNANQKRARDIVLLSCSFQKRDGGTFNPKIRLLTDILADPEVGKLALRTRVQVMNLIQQGRIEGTEFKEGNRLARHQNRELILGADFGGAINEARYLPAYWRYSGRSYQAQRTSGTILLL